MEPPGAVGGVAAGLPAARLVDRFMRELACKVIERWTVRVLAGPPGGAFSELGRILIQDGSSSAVHDALSKHYPGRFRPRSPAAVELHVTMDLLRDCASKITLLNPMVQAGYGAGGRVLRGVRGKKLAEVRKKGLADFDVVWGQGDKAFRARLIVSWNRSIRQYRCLVANLPRSRYTPEAIDQIYRLRWRIELPFKEWKSYANPAIAGG